MKWSVGRMWKVLSVLCLFRSLPCQGFIVKHLNPEVSKNLELLVFVLRNNRAWDYVLNQQIKLSYDDRPLYHDTTGDQMDPGIKEKLRLIDDPTDTVINPLPIIQRVVDRFSWLGSYVNYAVFVLNKALMCTTYEFLQLQIEIIVLMEEKSHTLDGDVWRNDPDKPLLKAWGSVVQFIDKVTALHGDLEILTDLSFEYTEFIMEHPGRETYVLKLMVKEIEKTIENQCERTNQKLIFDEFGVVITLDYLRGRAIKYEQLKNIFNKIISGMVTMFGNLSIETISMSNWSQILNFKTAVEEHINLYLKIDKMLQNDETGRAILREKEEKTNEKIRQLSEDSDKQLLFEGSSEPATVEESQSS